MIANMARSFIKEFGSDFHFIFDMESDSSHLFSDVNYYANGRHALNSLIKYGIEVHHWKRIWMPAYFCYDVIDFVKQTGIQISLYPDSPSLNDRLIFWKILYAPGDVLLRMNYFGMRSKRSNSKIPIPVIEDHSHDVCSGWALNSDADWCFASLRKTLPIPEGGILWSPKKHTLPTAIDSTSENETLTCKRTLAMFFKKMYLEKTIPDKDLYRRLFMETESEFNSLQLSGMSDMALMILRHLNIRYLQATGKRNWKLLAEQLANYVQFLCPEDSNESTPFLFVIQFVDERQREKARKKMIDNSLYPTLLWEIPEEYNEQNPLKEYLLSIHCDFRYSSEDMHQMANIILKAC